MKRTRIGAIAAVLLTPFLLLALGPVAFADGIQKKGKVAAAPADEYLAPPEAARSWTGLSIYGGAGITTADAFIFDSKTISYTAGLGYDYQFPNTRIVAGLLADISFSGGNDGLLSFDRSWYVGARLGGLLSDHLLGYGSVGYTSVDGGAPVFTAGSFEGLTLGAGLEFLVTKHVALTLDYRHVDLGSAVGPFDLSQDEWRFLIKYRF